MSDAQTIAVDPRTTYTEQRTEYVVFIPDDSWRGGDKGRSEITRYPTQEKGEEPGEARALAHVAHLHRLAVEYPRTAARRAEAFAVEQVITTTERRL